MTFSKNRIALLAVGAIVVIALGTTYRDALRKGPAAVREAAPRAAARQASAPESTGPRLVSLKGGGTRDLTAPTGKLLVVHFWATWCAPCEEELPALVEWWREAKVDPRIELLAVSVDEEWKTVDRFLAKRGAAGLPLALDPKRTAASAFGTEKFPETWFLSPAGKVVFRQIGPFDWSAPESKSVLQAIAAKALGPAPAAG